MSLACLRDGIIYRLLVAVSDKFVALDGREDESIAESVLDQFLDSGGERVRFVARYCGRARKGRLANESPDRNSAFSRGDFDTLPFGF